MLSAVTKFSLILGICLLVCTSSQEAVASTRFLNDLSYGLNERIGEALEDDFEDVIEDQLEDEFEDAIEDELENEFEDAIEDELEDEFEDAIEDELEDEFEDAIEDELEDEFEDAIEDELEDEFEDAIEDELEDEFEDAIEDELEDEFEDAIEDELEDEFEDAIEEELEDEFEDAIEDELEDEFEDAIEEELEDEFEDAIEEELEDEFEDAIEEELEDEFEDAIEDELEDEFEDAIEEELEDEFEDAIEEELEDDFEDAIEDELEDEFEDDIEGDAEDELENEFEEDFDEELDGEVEDDVDEELESVIPAAEDDLSDQSENLESEALDAIDNEVDLALDLFVDAEGRTAFSEEWVIMAVPEALSSLEQQGYLIRRTEDLQALGYVIGTIEAPRSFDPATSQITGLAVLNSDDVVIDRNGIYRPAASAVADDSSGDASLSVSDALQAIGMIDSSIARDHEVFSKANITEKRFNPEGYLLGTQHGTAVASLLVGESDSLRGYAAGAELFNAAVFSEDPNGAEFSTVIGVVRALNWLMSKGVKLVNMSLAGPHNAILERAITSACTQDLVIVAAVGNGGALAKPQYPAGYECTIGVTAVDMEYQPFYRAGRGVHVDFAGPGVNVLHADPLGYSRSTGTSFATPYVTGLLAGRQPGRQAAMQSLRSDALDVGDEGRDNTFGFGVSYPDNSQKRLR